MACLSIWIAIWWSGVALGGLYSSLGAGWRAISLKPMDQENTPNFYGETLYLGLGYSLGKIFDFNIFSRYTPATHDTTKFGQEDASIAYGGFQTAFRMGGTIYLGITGGLLRYKLLGAAQENDITKTWMGPGGEIVFGAFAKSGKHTFWQITLDVGSAQIAPEEEDPTLTAEEGQRILNWFGITINYAFIGLDALRIDNVFMQDWLNF